MDTQLNENLKVKNIKQNTMDGKITSPRLEHFTIQNLSKIMKRKEKMQLLNQSMRSGHLPMLKLRKGNTL